MAISTQNVVTTLRPTAWKWFLGAAVMFALVPPFGLIIAVVFILTGAGILQRISLSPEAITVRNWGSNKVYAWSDIDDFRVHKVKSGLITAANMVSFTHVSKQDSMIGKASKFLVGGTHSIPAIGMKAPKLVHLMQAYKQGFVPRDTPSEVSSKAPVAPPMIPVPMAAGAPPKTRPRAVPATPRAQPSRPKPKTHLGSGRRASTPLVQEGGGLFGRRRSTSPFEK